MRMFIALLAVVLPVSVFATDAQQDVSVHEVTVVSYQEADFEENVLFNEQDFVLEQIKFEQQDMDNVAVNFSEIRFKSSIDL